MLVYIYIYILFNIIIYIYIYINTYIYIYIYILFVVLLSLSLYIYIYIYRALLRPTIGAEPALRTSPHAPDLVWSGLVLAAFAPSPACSLTARLPVAEV